MAYVSPRRIRALNRQYRGKDYPTDTLSFGYSGETEDGLPFLGEVVLCPEIAANNALRWRTSADRELRKLLAHGILHLLGYDHETDHGEMNRLQQRLVRRRSFVRSGNVLARG